MYGLCVYLGVEGCLEVVVGGLYVVFVVVVVGWLVYWMLGVMVYVSCCGYVGGIGVVWIGVGWFDVCVIFGVVWFFVFFILVGGGGWWIGGIDGKFGGDIGVVGYVVGVVCCVVIGVVM